MSVEGKLSKYCKFKDYNNKGRSPNKSIDCHLAYKIHAIILDNKSLKISPHCSDHQGSTRLGEGSSLSQPFGMLKLFPNKHSMCSQREIPRPQCFHLWNWTHQHFGASTLWTTYANIIESQQKMLFGGSIQPSTPSILAWPFTKNKKGFWVVPLATNFTAKNKFLVSCKDPLYPSCSNINGLVNCS